MVRIKNKHFRKKPAKAKHIRVNLALEIDEDDHSYDRYKLVEEIKKEMLGYGCKVKTSLTSLNKEEDM